MAQAATKAKTNGEKADLPDPTASIELVRIEEKTILVPIEGTAPLIVHAWSEKARKMMLEAQSRTSKTRTKKEPRNPADDYIGSMYLHEDGWHGFPATGFKSAMVGAARLFDGVTMTLLKQLIYVEGEGPNMLVRIEGEPTMREDMVRVGMGVASLAFRAQYWPWKATLAVRYLPSQLSVDSIFALVDAAGIGGIGEWRPSKSASGVFGTFRVVGS